MKLNILLITWLVLHASCVGTQMKQTKNDYKKCSKTLHPLSQMAITVAKNDVFCYEGTVHASVGIAIGYEIKNNEIVKFHHDETLYKNKEAIKKGVTGADEATKILAFQALIIGETEVTIQEVFRGEVRQSYTFKITVK